MKFNFTLDIDPSEIVTIMQEQFRQDQERDKAMSEKFNRTQPPLPTPAPTTEPKPKK